MELSGDDAEQPASSTGSEVATTTVPVATTGADVDTGTADAGAPETTSTGADAQSTTVDATTGPDPACGNGIVEVGEVCYQLVEVSNTPTDYCHLAVGDIVGDSSLDLALARCSNNAVVVAYAGSPDGLGARAGAYFVGPILDGGSIRDLALGDFTNDGLVDMVVPDATARVVILRNAAVSPFSTALIATTPNAYSQVLAFEFGDDDLVDLIGGFNGDLFQIFVGSGSVDPFLTASGVIIPVQVDHQAQLHDVDVDGNLDLVLHTVVPGSQIEIYDGTPGGFVPDPVTVPVANLQEIAVGNFQGGATLELAVTRTTTETVRIFAPNEVGAYQPGTPMPIEPGDPRLMAAADLDRDGLDDLVTSHGLGAGSAVSLSANLGDGTLVNAQTEAISDTVQFLEVARLNDDEVPDVVVVATNGLIWQLLSDP